MIAVNSGNSRSQIESYARRHRISLPIIADTDRSLERQLKVGEVSLQNIWQAAILSADGRVTRGNASDLESTATRALQGAAWNVDPQGIPADLRSAWQAIEFGNYGGGAAAVTKGLRSSKPGVKEAAERLSNYTQAIIEEQLKAAEKAIGDNDKYEAYRLYSVVKLKFKGFSLPSDLTQTVRELAGDDTVKKEIAAMKRLDAAKKAMSSPSQSARKKSRRLLEALIATDPETKAGQEAQALLSSQGS